MSSKRPRASRPRKSSPPLETRKGEATPRAKWQGGRPLLVAVLLAGTASLCLWLRPRGPEVPALPRIATAQLNPASARVLEQHLSAVRRAPRSGAAWGKLGGILKSFEFRPEARRCLAIAERLDPNEPRWPYWQALLLETDSPARAIDLLRRAVALSGTEPDAPRMRLAKMLAEAGRWDEAARALAPLVDGQPVHPPAVLALARLAQARGDLTKAVSLANRCTNDAHTARAAWSFLSLLHRRLGDANASQNASQAAESLPADVPVADPFEMELIALRGDPHDLSDRAQRLLQSGRLAESAPILAQLVREQPQFAEGWLLLGRWQLLSEQPVAAEQSIRRHLQLDPQSTQGLFQLGMALLAQQRSAEAADAFASATRLKPDFGPAFFNLGWALARAKRPREAVAPLREAIRHNPERIDSYLLLAELYRQFDQNAQALELLTQAQALNPADRRVRALREKFGSE